MKQQRNKRKINYKLTLATLVALGVASVNYGQVAQAADAPVFTTPITKSVATNQQNFPNAKIEGTDDDQTITFNEPVVTFETDGSAINFGGDTIATINGKTINAFSKGSTGIDITDGDIVTINADLNIRAVGNKPWLGKGLGMGRTGTGEGDETHLTVNGSVTMKGPNAEQPWGVYTTAKNIHGGYEETDGYMGSRWSPVGIGLGMGTGSTITINGPVDLAVKGVAVKTDPFYPTKGLTGPQLATINLNAGGNIVVPDNTEDGWYSLASFGGTINANMNAGKTAPTPSTLKMLGNVIAIKGRMINGKYSGDPYFYQDGEINIGLGTADSYWKGVVDNAGKHYAGNVNIYLSKGATWDYTPVGSVNGLDGLHMPKPSLGHYGEYKPFSFVNIFKGGDSQSKAGFIIMKDKAPIVIQQYAGYTNVMYAHQNSGENTSDYEAGNVEITHAKPGSEITLLTDATNITTTDSAQTTKVLNALSGKLYYYASKDGEKNLSGRAGIASGLTSAAVIQQVSNINFNASGQGTVSEAPKPPVPEAEKPVQAEVFTKRIISDEYVLKDQWKYWAALGHNTSQYDYIFEAPTTLDITGLAIDSTQAGAPGSTTNTAGRFNGLTGWGAVMWAGYHAGSITMNEQPLTLNSNEGASRTTITGILVNSETLTLDKMGALNINVTTKDSNGSGIQVVGNNSRGAWYNGNGHSKLVVNNDDTPEHAVNIHLISKDNPDIKPQYRGIYAWKNSGTSDVEIKGLVNIDTPFGMGVWANGGNVSVGGGKITVADKGGYGLRSSIGGNILVNTKNVDGNLQLDSNDRLVQITGAIEAPTSQPGMYNVIGIGLGAAGSSLTGAIMSDMDTSAGVLNGVHLLMNEGTTWTNTENISSNWETASDGQSGGYVYNGSTVMRLLSHGGVIEQQNTLPITINQLDGSVTVHYKHTGDGTKTTDYVGGDTHILHATSGSTLTMLTDPTGLDLNTNKDTIFNTLAGKLVYQGWTQGEYNLKANVRIASGLTTSATDVTGDIQFNDNSGRGFYSTTARPDQTVTEFTQTITGDKSTNQAYVDQGVLYADNTYLFRQPSTVSVVGAPAIKNTAPVIINAKSGTLTLQSTADSGDVVTIDQNGSNPITADGKDLQIKAVAKTGKATAVQASGSTGKQSANITLAGTATITAQGSTGAVGVSAMNGALVNLVGNTTIDMSANTDSEAWAVQANGGTVQLNAGDTSQSLNVTGNIQVDKDGYVAMNLDSVNATWTGVSFSPKMSELSEDDQEEAVPPHGFNLNIHSGGTWMYDNVGKLNSDKTPTYVTTLRGGETDATAGRIVMRDTRDLYVDNFQGSMNIVYAHDNKGTEAADYKAGNIHFQSLANNGEYFDPRVNLITDSSGLNMTDWSEVYQALNALANKMYINPDSGSVIPTKLIIASDLTSSGVTQTFGRANFLNDQGQGGFTVPHGVKIENAINVTTQGTDKAYQDNDAFFNGNFEFTQDTKIDGSDNGNPQDPPFYSAAYFAPTPAPAPGEAPVVRTIDVAGHNLSLTAMNMDKSSFISQGGGADGIMALKADVALNNINELTITADVKNTPQKYAYGFNLVDSNLTMTDVKTTQVKVTAAQPDSAAAVYVVSNNKNASFINPNVMNVDVNSQSPVFLSRNLSGDKNATIRIEVGGGTFKTQNNVFANLTGLTTLTINKGTNNTVQMTGNILTKQNTLSISNVNTTQNTIDITLNTKDSSWKGAAGMGDGNTMNLTVANGAVWVSESLKAPTPPPIPPYSSGFGDFDKTGGSHKPGIGTEKQSVPKVRVRKSLDENGYPGPKLKKKKPIGPIPIKPRPEKPQPKPGVSTAPYTEVSSQHLSLLAGGRDDASRGFVVRNDNTPLLVDVAKGFLGIAYTHTGNGLADTDFAAGNTTITSANPGTDILMITNQDDIDVANAETLRVVYENLANKLTYQYSTLNENNIQARVGLASGLTASALQQAVTNDMPMYFDPTSGIGTLTEPPTQAASSPIITGDVTKDTYYKEHGNLKGSGVYTFTTPLTITTDNGDTPVSAAKPVHIQAGDNTISLNNYSGVSNTTNGIATNGPALDITARAVSVRTMNRSDRAQGIGVSNGSKTAPTNFHLTGDLSVNVMGKNYAIGIYSAGNSNVVIDGNVTMTGPKNNPYGVTNIRPGLADTYFSTSGIYAGSNYLIQQGPNVVVNGDVDLAVQNGAALMSNGGGSTININGGGHIVAKSDGPAMDAYAIVTMSGATNVNVNEGHTSTLGKDLIIDGNIGLLDDAINDNEPVKTSVVSIGLPTQDSVWTGTFISDITSEQREKGWTPSANLFLENGGLWNNQLQPTKEKPNYGVPVKLVGGETPERAGVIFQQSDDPITISEYSGHTVVSYEGTSNKKTTGSPVSFQAGDVTIDTSAPNSSIVLNTSEKGISIDDAAQVRAVLNELAHKLVYNGASDAAVAKNLTGRVQISSGLTSSIQALQIADISYDNNNRGLVAPEATVGAPSNPTIVRDPNHVFKPTVVQTPYESAIMRGARKAMTSASLQWRNVNDSVIRHAIHHEDMDIEGPWVSLENGAFNYNDGTGVFTSNMTGFTMGADRQVSDTFRTGAAITHRQTTDSYDDMYMGLPTFGSGKVSATAASVYATKSFSNGGRIHAVGSVGQVSNPYNASNEMGLTLVKGTYRATGFNTYVGYDKTFERSSGFFMVPRIGLHWSRLAASNYKVKTKDDRTMQIRQQAYQSLVGNLGISFGRQSKQGSYYMSLDMYREMKGQIAGTYSAGLNPKSTSYNGQQTWFGLGIGADYALNNVTTFSLQMDKTWGSDFTKKWGVKAQLRHHF